MIQFLVYLGSGKLLLFLAKKFPPIQWVANKWELLQKLYSCDLCFGFWFYLFLTPFFNINVDYIDDVILGWVITAMLSTFMMQLLSVGFEELYGTLRIVEDA